MTRNGLVFFLASKVLLVALIYCPIAFVVCALPWGSYGWMGALDMQKISPEEARSNYIEQVLDKDIVLDIFQHSILVKAGDRIRVLGCYRNLPENSRKKFVPDDKFWVIESSDGRRGRADVSVLESGPSTVLFDHARDGDAIKFHHIMREAEMRELVRKGISFAEAENIFGPAVNAAPDLKTGCYVAGFRGFDYKGNDRYREFLLLYFADGKLHHFENSDYINEPWTPRILINLSNWWMDHSVAYVKPGFYRMKYGYGPFQKATYKYNWLARGMQGVYDILFGMLVLVLLVIVGGYTFLDVTRSNAMFLFILFLLASAAYIPYVVYTMEMSPNLILFHWSTVFAFGMLAQSMQHNRCPRCHRIVFMEHTNCQYGPTKQIDTSTGNWIHTGERDYNKYAHGYTHEDQYQHLKHHGSVRYRELLDTYTCPNCGYSFDEHNSETLSHSHRSYIDKEKKVTTNVEFYK